MITEHDRLVALATIAHARLEALEWMTIGELTAIQEEAEAMTVDEVEVMLIELKVKS